MGPLLFSLCFFHVLALGRRQFGRRGYGSPCTIRHDDLLMGATIIEDYLARSESIPWGDLRRSLGEIVYGDRVTDAHDKRVFAVYLRQTFRHEIMDPSAAAQLAPGFDCVAEGSHEEYMDLIENLPSETPELFGMPTSSQGTLLRKKTDDLCLTLTVLAGGVLSSCAQFGHGKDAFSKDALARASRRGPMDHSHHREARKKEATVAAAVQDIMARLPAPFHVAEIKKAAGAPTPYTVALLQEVHRANHIVLAVRRSLSELSLCLMGGVNTSHTMEQLIDDIFNAHVPMSWLEICLQHGPTGSYTLKSLPAWVDDLLQRTKQLATMAAKKMALPPSVWLGGLWNPMGFICATLQAASRQKGQTLDAVVMHAQFTVTWPEDLWAQPDEGVHVHGFYLDGARWDVGQQVLTDADPSEHFPEMPVLHIRGVLPHELPNAQVYTCPVYSSSLRGPTYLFAAPLCTERDPSCWVLAAVALFMQPEE